MGTPGCSRFFLMGVLDAEDSQGLADDIDALRKSLLADAYYRNVPSMSPDSGKTAVFFHAKDDLPEVRREVFRILIAHQLRFSAVVRDKRAVLDYVRLRNASDPHYRFQPTDLYFELATRLFADRLGEDEEHEVVFARRVKSNQESALRRALGLSRESSHVRVTVCPSNLRAELQAVDYLLWALQRLFEQGEERFIEYVWGALRSIHDVDDVHESRGGTIYSQTRPLTLAALREARDIGADHLPAERSHG